MSGDVRPLSHRRRRRGAGRPAGSHAPHPPARGQAGRRLEPERATRLVLASSSCPLRRSAPEQHAHLAVGDFTRPEDAWPYMQLSRSGIQRCFGPLWRLSVDAAGNRRANSQSESPLRPWPIADRQIGRLADWQIGRLADQFDLEHCCVGVNPTDAPQARSSPTQLRPSRCLIYGLAMYSESLFRNLIRRQHGIYIERAPGKRSR